MADMRLILLMCISEVFYRNDLQNLRSQCTRVLLRTGFRAERHVRRLFTRVLLCTEELILRSSFNLYDKPSVRSLCYFSLKGGG